ncbi:cyclohexanone monooxygenase [Trichosporon asahii var. asahii CBS 8904]|uniref:Cyclohexanone monooxygenase n=1 Tax=Trichosporon asahii var. asahii (strain CBS 8904) TaxID=1220162 RepID=K1VG10_TRIAC|nr:cyclohexanone monooxygenase [Trichosporon asahii var. asahii CBS 8904]
MTIDHIPEPTDYKQTQPVAPLADEERQALQAKYREERDKRLRADGINQYKPLGGILKLDEDKDPYTDVQPREPVHDHVDFLFLGGGFAGLTVCAKLKQAGFDSIRILESGGDFGGVWYWNRFPGAMCDTAAMVYLPMMEEVGTVPSAKYVRGPEILAHAHRIARHFDLYPHALFSTHLEELRWDEDRSVYVVKTREGDEFTATNVAMGTGPLNRPHLPGIPGLETFKGQAMHTARWDFGVTGGGWDDEVLEGLKDKRVGVIGTGATGVQCIPTLGRDSGSLHVFQRTPSAVAIRGNHAIDKEWFSQLDKGWQTKWLRNFCQLMSTGYAPVDYVHDGWTDGVQRITKRMLEMCAKEGRAPTGMADYMKAYHLSDDEYTTAVRARTDEVVKDPETADKLKAWYRQFCKRPTFHDEYLQTFNRPNVTLVDTDGKGVERIDETGVWANGKHYDLDVLVYATGFEFNSEYTYKSGLEVYGRGGRTLTDAWKDGMQSFQGMHVHGFPNLFVIGFAQGSSLASNITSNYTEHGPTVLSILQKKKELGAKTVEVPQKTQDDWIELILQGDRGIIGGPECTPGYYNNEGQEEGRRERLNVARYPAGPLAFFDYIAEWRANGKFEGLEFDGKPVEIAATL